MAEVTRDAETASMLSETDVSEIQHLHKERSELKLRLQKLEDKKGAAKPEIVEKVRKDYKVKLEQVESALESKSSGLKSELERLQAERKDVLGEKAKIDDAMEELELRHLVGEFADELKGSLETAKVDELDKIVLRIRTLEDKIATVSQMLNPEAPPPAFEKIKVPEKPAQRGVQEPVIAREPPSELLQEGQDTGTIKCPTCGTSNRHDNWYCEKCGRELLGVQM